MIQELQVILLIQQFTISESILDRTGWHRNFTFMTYGERWRSRRRQFRQVLNQHNVHTYHPTVTKTIRKMLCALLDDPCGDVMKHIRR